MAACFAEPGLDKCPAGPGIMTNASAAKIQLGQAICAVLFCCSQKGSKSPAWIMQMARYEGTVSFAEEASV